MGVGVFLDENGAFSLNFVSSFSRGIDRWSRYFDKCYSNWIDYRFFAQGKMFRDSGVR